MSHEQSHDNPLSTTTVASDLAEISSLREQIFANARALFSDRANMEIIVTTAEWPESGYYGARLVDMSTHVLLLGRLYAPSVPEALGQLLQATCDGIRDAFVLSHYRSM